MSRELSDMRWSVSDIYWFKVIDLGRSWIIMFGIWVWVVNVVGGIHPVGQNGVFIKVLPCDGKRMSRIEEMDVP